MRIMMATLPARRFTAQTQTTAMTTRSPLAGHSFQAAHAPARPVTLEQCVMHAR
jgi:hypothetical protein